MNTQTPNLEVAVLACAWCQTAPATVKRKGEGFNGVYDQLDLCRDCARKPYLGTCDWCKRTGQDLVRREGTSEDQYQAFFVCVACAKSQDARDRAEAEEYERRYGYLHD